jgi:hypothetical protein
MSCNIGPPNKSNHDNYSEGYFAEIARAGRVRVQGDPGGIANGRFFQYPEPVSRLVSGHEDYTCSDRRRDREIATVLG